MIKFFKSLFGPLPDQIKILDEDYSAAIETIREHMKDMEYSDTIFLGSHEFSAVTRMQLVAVGWPDGIGWPDGEPAGYRLLFMGRTLIPVNREFFIGRERP